jgi:threonine aldolase
MHVIDLRSDTVTRPSAEMRQAIANAVVGDDVLGDDPTVKELERYIADLFGREAALFMPSGTMANQVCLKVHSQPGWELLCDRECHVVNYECAGPAVHSGLLVNLLTTERGMITADMVRNNIRIKSLHSPETRMVTLENTHNRHGGTILPQNEILRVKEVCDEFELILHLDGARIWNVHAATGLSFEELTRPFDSISCCLSKGLGAPVGSLAVGSHDFIDKCLRERKLFGGGMRQVGILAAAGLYALQHNLGRLKEDHDNASFLAEELDKFDVFNVDRSRVETNIVACDINSDLNSVELCEKMKEVDVWVIPFGARRLRCVTHLDVSRADCEEAIERLKTILD